MTGRSGACSFTERPKSLTFISPTLGMEMTRSYSSDPILFRASSAVETRSTDGTKRKFISRYSE